MMQDEGRHAGLLRQQRKPAADGKPVFLGPCCHNHHHRSQGAAADPVGCGAQRLMGSARPKQHELPRIKPKLLQSRCMNMAKLAIKKSLPDEKHRPPRCGPVRKPQHSAERCRSVAETRGPKLMQRCPFQAPAQG